MRPDLLPIASPAPAPVAPSQREPERPDVLERLRDLTEYFEALCPGRERPEPKPEPVQ